jgi:hypothetical protein
MVSPTFPITASSFRCLVVLFLAFTALEGCGTNPTDEARVEEYFKDTPGVKRAPVGKLSGHVSVDGQPPGKRGRVYVILSDPDHPAKSGAAPPIFTKCEEDGKFEFTTYATGDGVPYGKYVITFVSLHRGGPTGRGLGSRAPSFTQQFVGPDALNNLYNDPEKNKADQTFLVKVEAPGRTDYDFNLTVSGKDPVKEPGTYAVTAIRD